VGRWEDVHRLREQEHKSGREIARLLGISRNTVSKLLELPQAPRHARTGCSKLQPYYAEVIALLQAHPGLPATHVLRRLTELGYDGGLTTVKEFVATISRRQSLARSDGVRRPEGQRTYPPMVVHVLEDGDQDGSGRPGSEAGMNLISVDFDIMMVNRVNERLFKKPMVELLGKKCYAEFERRNDVCPHCPGVAALTTGRPHQVETKGIRDDGTKYAVRLTAHPIMSPRGEPVGFVEVEEDITERRRSEDLAELVEGLQASLASTHDVAGAVRQALNVAFSLEGVDFGCAYVRDRVTGEYRSVAQRGVSQEFAGAVARQAVLPQQVPGTRLDPNALRAVRVVGKGPTAVELVPVLHDGQTLGVLLLGSSAYHEFPPATHAAFEALGNIVGSAVTNLQALQLQRETRADVEALLSSLPLPVWCLDGKGRVSLWNRAAERVFGWSAAEVYRGDLPLEFTPASDGPHVSCSTKSGDPLQLLVTSIPLPRALGPSRRSATVAHEVSPCAVPPIPLETIPGSLGSPTDYGEACFRVLLLENDPAQRRLLTRALRSLGCRVVVCEDGAAALSRYVDGLGSKRPYDLVVTELLPAAGPSGLELASALHRTDPHVQVVLTADAPIVGFESHGLAGALRKPFDIREVRRTVSPLVVSKAGGPLPRSGPPDSCSD
jgi:PAS domain S-box-containing protein